MMTKKLIYLDEATRLRRHFQVTLAIAKLVGTNIHLRRELGVSEDVRFQHARLNSLAAE